MILKNHEGQHVSHTLALLEQHQRKKAGASLQSVTDSTRSHLVQYVNEERQTRNASTYKKLQQEWFGNDGLSPAHQPPTESEEPVANWPEVSIDTGYWCHIDGHWESAL